MHILSLLTYIYRSAVTSPIKYLAGKARQQIKTFGPLITFVKNLITALYGDEFVMIDISKTDLNIKKFNLILTLINKLVLICITRVHFIDITA